MMKPKTILLTLLLAVISANAGADAYTIYPVPHEQKVEKGTASFAAQVSIIAERGIDEYTVQRAKGILEERGLKVNIGLRPQKGTSVVYLGVNGSGGEADRMAKRMGLRRDVFEFQKYDRHVLHLTAVRGVAQVVVLGENTDAVFCGLATLEQMLDQGTKKLPCATFYDYADVQNRGVIEGYYGVPYSMEVTADLFRFMARYKLNVYMYGAKSDPYHSHHWDQPYPKHISAEQKRIGMMTEDMMRRLTEVAHQSKVNFIWAIHPGQSFTNANSTDVLDRIMEKFQKMYDLGVRQFGVFVDDVGVPTDEPTLTLGANRLTRLQEMQDERWNRPGAAPADTVKPLQYVPQLYAFSWVDQETARRFWESLRPVSAKTSIYTTGYRVWSVPNSKDVDVLNDYLGREVSWWWNYPCNDNDMTKIFVADTYSNFADESKIVNSDRMEPGLNLKTIILNPMQQGELSKIALFSAADYTWNMADFDNMKSWRASLPAVVGKGRAESFERIVPYLRYYDEQTPLARYINNYEQAYETADKRKATEAAEAIDQELERIVENCDIVATLSENKSESDSLFYVDQRPWLLKLRTMAASAQVLLRAQAPNGQQAVSRVDFAKAWAAVEDLEQNPQYRFDVLTGLGSEISLSVRTAEPAAKSLRPFLSWLLAKHETQR